MILKNIGIEANKPITEVKVDNILLDLHNMADFLGYSYDVDGHTFEMLFLYSMRTGEIYHLRLRFNAVKHLDVSPRDSEMPPGEDKTLGHLHMETEGEEYIEFSFWGGIRITVQADEVIATLEPVSGWG
ncbi:MAG: hypothetical protein K6T91_10325 [Firmicutes bacterium]|nr:hypothetical protein [Bacillota bacterium]